MDDASVQTQRERIEKLIEYWKGALWLGHWHVHHSFYRTKRDGDADDQMVAAQVKVQWEYMSAQIDWYLPAVAAMDDDDLEPYVVHEYMHIVLSEMGNPKKVDKHEERVATHMAYVLVDFRKQSSKAPEVPDGQAHVDGQDCGACRRADEAPTREHAEDAPAGASCCN